MSWFDLGMTALNVAGRVGAAGAANPAQSAPNTSGGLFDSSGWTVSTGGSGTAGDLSRYLPWAVVALVAVLYFKGRR